MSYIDETGLVEFPSGNDCSQLLQCPLDDDKIISRVDYVVGQNGVVRLETTQELIEYVNQAPHFRKFIKLLQEYSFYLIGLVQQDMLSGESYIQFMEFIDFGALNDIAHQVEANQKMDANEKEKLYMTQSSFPMPIKLCDDGLKMTLAFQVFSSINNSIDINNFI